MARMPCHVSAGSLVLKTTNPEDCYRTGGESQASCARHLWAMQVGSLGWVGMSWPQNESGEPILAPRFFRSLSHVPWQRPRNAASGAHRKSGVIIRLSYACTVESYLLPSACSLLTPLHDELQDFSLPHPSARSEAVREPVAETPTRFAKPALGWARRAL